jgi:hypothetical protein
MKNIITREVKRVKGYPDYVIDFMLVEDNWVLVDSDGSLGENALLSYPESIFVLSLESASDNVRSFLSGFKNLPRSDFAIKFNTFEDECEEELSSEDYDVMNQNCIFAYCYTEDLDEELINESCFQDGNHVFIYNGLDFSIEQDMEEQSLLAINVSNYETF